MAKTIALDFDGVLHAYTTPWTTAGEVNDGPTPGALEAVKRYKAAGLIVIIYSARASDPEGLRAIIAWLKEHHFPRLTVRADKPHAQLYVDDRGFQFNGSNWPSVKDVMEFVPWNRKPVERMADDLVYFSCDAKAERYEHTDPDEAIREWLDYHDELPRDVTVYRYELARITESEIKAEVENALSGLLERLDEEYGDPDDGTEASDEMYAAVDSAVRKVVSLYRVWTCVESPPPIIVQVAPWIRKHQPQWLEEERVRAQVENMERGVVYVTQEVTRPVPLDFVRLTVDIDSTKTDLSAEEPEDEPA